MKKFMKTFVSQNEDEKFVFSGSGEFESGEEKILMTSTNEPMMPVRLYFRFVNRKKLYKALQRRHCIDWDSESDFMLSYWEEARHMDLDVPYDEVPEDIFPILLAKGRIINNSEVHIDVRSFKRAVEVIHFLYKYIGAQFLYITHIASYNRYLTATSETLSEIMNMNFDDLFSDVKTQMDFPFEEVSRNKGAFSSTEWAKHLDKMINSPLPVVTKLPVKGTKAELSRINTVLMINMALAQEYWEGNTTCTSMDIIGKVFNHMLEKEGLAD